MGRWVVRWHLEGVKNKERIRVLVVDDSPLFREALANFVGHLDGVMVVGRASDGHEALALAASTQAQVVFMDLMMPRLDGVAATRALKQMLPPPAVIACSTYEDDRLREQVLEAGADVFVHKRDLSVEAEALLRRLGARFERGPGGEP
jgi:NarL family two-component system response regulator LiaR